MVIILLLILIMTYFLSKKCDSCVYYKSLDITNKYNKPIKETHDKYLVLKEMGLPNEICEKIINNINSEIKCCGCNNNLCEYHSNESEQNAIKYRRNQCKYLCNTCVGFILGT